MKKTLFLFSLIVIPLVVYSLSLLSKKVEIKEPIINAIVEATTSPLEKIAKNSILKEEGDYAIYISNLKTKEEYLYNENKIFNSASLYKLWVMAVAYDKISKGQLDPSEILKGDARELDIVLEVASDSAQVSPTPEKSEEEKKEEDNRNSINYSLDNAIKQMIAVSDNYAALLVASRAGNLSVQNYINNNLSDSSFGQPPKTTAKDIGIFFEKLYKGEIVNSFYSKEMISLLKKQILNDRIPKYLPIETEVAHKTGELGDIKHDAGIVFSPNADYIIVVLSKTNNSNKASEQIALFSKEIYNYFN